MITPQNPATPPETDLQKFLDLMHSFGLTPTVDRIEGRPLQPGTMFRNGVARPEVPESTVVSLRAHEGGVEGYGGFSADFAFNLDGTFDAVCVWE